MRGTNFTAHHRGCAASKVPYGNVEALAFLKRFVLGTHPMQILFKSGGLIFVEVQVDED